MWNRQNRDDYRIIRCIQCPKWVFGFDGTPITAYTTASKHARRHSGHEVTVINVTKLEVEYRYQFDAMTDLADDPPF